MPFYEYRRPDGTTFEVMQKMSDPPLTHDPDDPDAPVERVFHPIAVHFKGKGFYNTDYGTRKRQREKAASEGSSDAKSSDPAKTPSESKPSSSSDSSSTTGSSSPSKD